MKKISIITPCYNEEGNVESLFKSVCQILEKLNYQFEHVFIDNCSTDNTRTILRKMASIDKRVKVILNSRNFGHIRSPYHGLLQCTGDAVIMMAADFQEPPEIIPEFIKAWESGYKVVKGVKSQSEESKAMFTIRSIFYYTINKLSDINLTKNFTGFGLYDKEIVILLRKISDPYPYLRGLISEIGFKQTEIQYKQPKRFRGITKNNFYTLYDMAMLGITCHTKVPLRVMTFIGFVLGLVSLGCSAIYLTLKLTFWYRFEAGMAPIMLGIFFIGSVQLFSLGILGEYIGAIFTQVLNRPAVIETERINFIDNENNVGGIVANS
jgi:polyisoprenyl-phosphate glycosyltransferase